MSERVQERKKSVVIEWKDEKDGIDNEDTNEEWCEWKGMWKWTADTNWVRAWMSRWNLSVEIINLIGLFIQQYEFLSMSLITLKWHKERSEWTNEHVLIPCFMEMDRWQLCKSKYMERTMPFQSCQPLNNPFPFLCVCLSFYHHIHFALNSLALLCFWCVYFYGEIPIHLAP